MIDGAARDLELLSGWLSQTAEIERLGARFQALADGVSAGVAVMTRDRVLYANDHVQRILGRPAADLPTLALAGIFPDPQVRARVRAALRRAWNGTAEDLRAITLSRPDGTTAHVTVAVRPLPRELEPTLLVVADDTRGGVGPAVTRPEGDALRAFGLYLASVANDLRAPLTAYLGHLTLLTRRTDLPEDLREAFEVYRQVTAETLDRFARAMEWGRRVPLVERVDLRAVVEAAIATLENELSSADVGLALDLETVPPIAGNRDQLQLAVEHVIRNAWEALRSRGGAISIRLTTLAGRRVRLMIADDGPGIPDSILPHVFEPFSSTKSITAGMGLGLAIVKDIVRRHQGEVAVQSSTAGTTVTFGFDTIDTADPATFSAIKRTRRRLLLIEDNLAVQETYRMLFEKAGWDVLTATDADQALLAVIRDHVDALLVDVQMAGRDGLAVIEALATWHPELLPRVALHTAYAYEDRVRDVADRYGIALLEKPCAFETLLATLARLAVAP